MRRSIRIFAVFASICVAFTAQAGNKTELVTVSASKPLPPLTYSDATNALKMIDFSQGTLTVVHFWATWCRPCVVELPELDAAAHDYLPKNVQVVALALDGKNLDKVEEFFRTNNISTLTPALDEHGNTFRTLRGKGLPISIFFDSHGQIVARTDGPVEWKRGIVPAFIDSYLSSSAP